VFRGLGIVLSSLRLHWSRAAMVAAIVALVSAYPIASSQDSDDVTLRIIVVDARDQAERVVADLQRGENFVVLAKKVSLDPSADTGGMLGRLPLSGLRPELRSALDGVAVGQLSPIVTLPTGFAVLKVVPHEEAGDSPATPNRSVSATGAVKYVLDVGGFGVASVLLSEVDKPQDWNLDPRTICQMRTQSFTSSVALLEKDITTAETTRTGIQPFELMQLHFVLGQIHAYHGRMEKVIEQFERSYRLALSDVPDAIHQSEQALGVAHLHKAELDNGFFHAPGDRCLLSAAPGRPLSKTADVVKAIEYFTKYLAARPDDLEVKWLLNLAHMAAGTYPSGVAAAQLIPPAALRSSEDVGRFVDVAPQAGLTSFASAGGVIVDDFDNDGRLDVVTSSFNACEPMRFFRRDERGQFVEQGAKAGLADQVGGLNTLQTDYDNDGDLDILLLRGAWEVAQRKSLLRNNGDGTFTDVTASSGLMRPATSTQAAAWTDVNQDGFVDLFIGNEDSPAQLFLNQRDGTFVDIAEKAGVNRSAFSKGVGAADYDNDGWPDLYVSNLGGTNFLYHNNRNGTFTELAAAAGVPGSGQGFATWFFDYDNDGWQDLFVTSYFTSVDETVRTYLRLPNNAGTLKLYRNLRDGSFQDVSRQVGLDKVYMPMGANFGDLDNDGFLDIYLGTGNPSYASLVPSVLLRNKAGTAFVDVTESSGTGEIHKGHGVAFADLDHDGDEEIIFEVGGATPGDAHALRLFENPGHGNDWITLKLVGAKSNRAAFGARITVTVENTDGARRTIHRTVGSGGSFGASPLQQHIGLGASARVVDVEVWWPTSNTRQRFAGVAKNQFLQITELATDYTRLDRRLQRLGGSANHDTSATR